MSKEEYARLEEMMGRLIKMVGENNAVVKRLEQDVRHLQQEVSELRQDVSDFKDETNHRFDRLEKQVRFTEADNELLYKKTTETEREVHRIKHQLHQKAQ